MNRKKIQRLWREEGLRVPKRKGVRLRLGDSTLPAQGLRAERPNHVWALDFQFDSSVEGRTLKLLHVVDEHTREALAVRVARSIDADHTVRVLDQIVQERGAGHSNQCHQLARLLGLRHGSSVVLRLLFGGVTASVPHVLDRGSSLPPVPQAAS